MKSQIETLRDWLLRKQLPKTLPVQQPMKPEENDNLLARLDDSDPTLKCFLDHARDKFNDHLQIVLDLSSNDADRLRHANAASALCKFIEGFEGARTQAKEQRKRRLEEEREREK